MIFDAPEVIGHRGAGRGAVDGLWENTRESFHAAIEQGASWIELDVRRSADDELLVHHDGALPDGRVIVDMPAARSREAGVLTLREALETIPPDIGVDVDVKTVMEDARRPPGDGTTGLLLRHLAHEARHRRLFVCSFDPAVLLTVRDTLPEVPVAWMPFVRNPLDQAVAGAAGLGCQAVCIEARSFGVTGEEPHPGRRGVAYTVDIAHRSGLEVVSWCPDPVDAARFVDAGVDAVVVDDIPGVIAALKQAPEAGGSDMEDGDRP